MLFIRSLGDSIVFIYIYIYIYHTYPYSSSNAGYTSRKCHCNYIISIQEFRNYTDARDTFLAHMGATLWGSMRHIISPSVADGAFHYYETISFQLFFITQEKVGHINKLHVDFKALMNGISFLLLLAQNPMFSSHMLPLSDDPALAMAFSVARHAVALPLLLVNGTFRTTIRSYIDSSILLHQLQRLNEEVLCTCRTDIATTFSRFPRFRLCQRLCI
ncbi:hypothetical protein GIB67_008933 [Kingdonia uniflora]|uniref:Uncharacterized protein n=1 Tax=Kingdonia uniflora TaxID=39325 RepID=A0A7J7LVP0_9MAGN|nr:hypothetical protein GIB67_008933 [Kingdonia uniflora]